MPQTPGFAFKLTAEPDNVPVVRRALRALLTSAAVAPERALDILLASTEVCANAVLHAYPDRDGVFNVEARLLPERIEVVICDHGQGMEPSLAPGGPSLGLTLTAARSSELQIETLPGLGTEVRLTFRTRSQGLPCVELTEATRREAAAPWASPPRTFSTSNSHVDRRQT
jgi:serine/threonine-protein kinase RsbW